MCCFVLVCVGTCWVVFGVSGHCLLCSSVGYRCLVSTRVCSCWLVVVIMVLLCCGGYCCCAVGLAGRCWALFVLVGMCWSLCVIVGYCWLLLVPAH